MSRTSLVARQETDKGAKYSWGHLWVMVKGRPGDTRHIRAGSNDVVGSVTNANGTEWLSVEHANVMSDLLRAAVVNAGGTTCGGKTILELLWEELDAIMDRLMTGAEADDERDPGRAEGVAYSIAVMQNPYLPNVDNVREQAMQRWEAAEAAPKPAPISGRSINEKVRARRAARKARRA